MRYKEYNTNNVLEKAINLFWQNGFNGCSINDIVEETGVNRFSLYNEFSSKEGILYQSLQLYRERYCKDKLASLSLKGDLENILANFYSSYLQDQQNVIGCYFIHIGTELADSDERVKKIVDDYLDEIYNSILILLTLHGYKDFEPAFRARHLLGLFCTAMSFCLIHTEQRRKEYISNGINLILSKNVKYSK